jgi:hypothetical protein
MARILGWPGCFAALLVLAGCAAFGSLALEFTPATLPSCKGPLIVVHVRWDFETKTRQPVRIYVSSPGERRKLWTIAAPKGEMDTGRWMHDGSTITVRSSKGRLLGIRTLEATPCKKSD